MTNVPSERREGGGVYPMGDWEGIPVQFGVEFMVNVLNNWGQRIAEGAVSSDLMDEITAGLAEREAVFPRALLWDKSRTVLAGDLFERGFVNESIGLLHGIYSPHVMAHAALDLARRQEGRYGDVVMSSLMMHLQGNPDEGRFKSFIQAVIDRRITEDPYDPQIDMFEGMLRVRDRGYDPVESWANSQHIRDPDANWNEMPAMVRDENLWTGSPFVIGSMPPCDILT